MNPSIQEAITDLAKLGHWWSLLADTEPEEFIKAVKREIVDLRKALREIIETHDACESIEYKGAPAGTDKRRTKAFKAARRLLANRT